MRMEPLERSTRRELLRSVASTRCGTVGFVARRASESPASAGEVADVCIAPSRSRSSRRPQAHLVWDATVGCASGPRGDHAAARATVPDKPRPRVKVVPGELVSAQPFFDPAFNTELLRGNAAHVFIYRDPRDVVASEADEVHRDRREAVAGEALDRTRLREGSVIVRGLMCSRARTRSSRRGAAS